MLLSPRGAVSEVVERLLGPPPAYCKTQEKEGQTECLAARLWIGDFVSKQEEQIDKSRNY